jgi:hypothetical protein
MAKVANDDVLEWMIDYEPMGSRPEIEDTTVTGRRPGAGLGTFRNCDSRWKRQKM